MKSFMYLAACLVTLPAMAATVVVDGSGLPSVKVTYSDLNLASDKGANTLYRRIVSAAHQVCGADEVDIRDLATLAQTQSCERQAIAHAVDAVHSPRLASAYSAHLRHG